jgi:uncharacterized protein (UPF0332 family)
MDGWDFFIVARKLSQSRLECDLRTSVSRSYFAAFNGIAAFLRTRVIRLPKGPEAHEKLVACLRNSGDVALEEVGEKLDELRRQRNTADYDMDADSLRVGPLPAQKALEKLARLRQKFEGVPEDQRVTSLRRYWISIGQLPS